MKLLKILTLCIGLSSVLSSCAKPPPRLGIVTPATVSIEYYDPGQLSQASMMAQHYCDGIGKNAQFVSKEACGGFLSDKCFTAYFACVAKGHYEIGGQGPTGNTNQMHPMMGGGMPIVIKQ